MRKVGNMLIVVLFHRHILIQYQRDNGLTEHMGKGYGKLLLQAAIAELKKMGYEDIFLWVLRENIRARN